MNWKASHDDRTFYACSDVVFPGRSSRPRAVPFGSHPHGEWDRAASHSTTMASRATTMLTAHAAVSG